MSRIFPELQPLTGAELSELELRHGQFYLQLVEILTESANLSEYLINGESLSTPQVVVDVPKLVARKLRALVALFPEQWQAVYCLAIEELILFLRSIGSRYQEWFTEYQISDHSLVELYRRMQIEYDFWQPEMRDSTVFNEHVLKIHNYLPGVFWVVVSNELFAAFKPNTAQTHANHVLGRSSHADEKRLYFSVFPERSRTDSGRAELSLFHETIHTLNSIKTNRLSKKYEHELNFTGEFNEFPEEYREEAQWSYWQYQEEMLCFLGTSAKDEQLNVKVFTERLKHLFDAYEGFNLDAPAEVKNAHQKYHQEIVGLVSAIVKAPFEKHDALSQFQALTNPQRLDRQLIASLLYQFEAAWEFTDLIRRLEDKLDRTRTAQSH